MLKGIKVLLSYENFRASLSIYCNRKDEIGFWKIRLILLPTIFFFSDDSCFESFTDIY